MTQSNSYRSGDVLLLAGTKHDLFLISSHDREHWHVEKTTLEAQHSRIYYAVFNTHKHYRLFVTDNGNFGEAHLRYSDDFGQSWQQPKRDIQFDQKSGLRLKEIWYIEPGRVDEPETMYMGTDPACLWESHDYGKSWEANEAMLTYPERTRWGSGLAGTCLHSIVVDYADKKRLWVGISGAGTLRSDDGGKSWRTLNTMVAGDQKKDINVGTNSHRLIQHPTQAEVLYQQSRNGIFKSLDGGEHWQSILSNLPSSFGFPLALDVHQPDTLFALPLDPEDRYSIGEQFAVYRTENAGKNWETMRRGLPYGRYKVLRHTLCTDELKPCGVYVGTMSGELFASNDRGESWQMISDTLPAIYSLTAAILR
jgi:photosystem II stability/assembly factor-like uncharacterized protein